MVTPKALDVANVRFIPALAIRAPFRQRFLNHRVDNFRPGVARLAPSGGPLRVNRRNFNFTTVFAGQPSQSQTDEHIWLVSFMHNDVGYFDNETCRLEPLQNPSGVKVLLMSPE